MSAGRSFWPPLVIIATCALLVGGVAELFRLRFFRGDVFPAYSSLRSDPLGTRVLHDAFPGAGIETHRNMKNLRQAKFDGGTIYVLGASWDWLAKTDIEEARPLLEAAENGARVVVALRADSPPGSAKKKTSNVPVAANEPEKVSPGEETPAESPDSREDAAPKKPPAVSLRESWALEREWLDRLDREGRQATRTESASDVLLPDSLIWHSPALLATDEPAWQARYEIGGKPVMLEREQGSGSIVLMSDAYLLSNEAMLTDREPGLIAWLQGGSTAAVFDENHLGVQENIGVGALARRYGLEHAALVLIAIALLFVWKNSSSLVPADAVDAGTPRETNEFAGRDSAAGFVNLLRRTLPARDLFATCVAEYRRSRAWQRHGDEDRLHIDSLVNPAAAHDPVEASRRAHELLARKHASRIHHDT